MNILIDNKDLKSYFGIDILDYTGLLSLPAEREDNRQWADKSGIDKNLDNIRYEPKEFQLSCICKASNEVAAYALIKALTDYMFLKGIFVLSLRDTVAGIRECFLCERSSTIVGEINVRQQNSLYAFKLGLRDVNPNALAFKTTVSGLLASINYTKGQTAPVFWGDGDRELVSNSGNYNHTYASNGLIDIIVDVDQNAATVATLNANFSANVVSGQKPLSVQFTDLSSGTVEIYSWDFGDGYTSSEQNPSHTYQTNGSFTVTLQVFNSVKGSDTEIKTTYIVVRNSYIMINGSDSILINSTNHLLKN